MGIIKIKDNEFEETKPVTKYTTLEVQAKLTQMLKDVIAYDNEIARFEESKQALIDEITEIQKLFEE